MCILDYLKDHDGASQRAICEYTLLPRQTVNNVIASFVAHGFVELGDAEGDRRVKRSVSRLPGADIATA